MEDQQISRFRHRYSLAAPNPKACLSAWVYIWKENVCLSPTAENFKQLRGNCEALQLRGTEHERRQDGARHFKKVLSRLDPLAVSLCALNNIQLKADTSRRKRTKGGQNSRSAKAGGRRKGEMKKLWVRRVGGGGESAKRRLKIKKQERGDEFNGKREESWDDEYPRVPESLK